MSNAVLQTMYDSYVHGNGADVMWSGGKFYKPLPLL